jgi:NACalpha-BTF3-like transcription factor
MDTSTSTTTAPEHASDNTDNCENKIISDTDTELLDAHSETVTQPKTQQDLIREYYQNLQKHKYERFIEITMNQTTYTREEAIASLEKHKGDITLVIKEFLGVTDKREEREKELNSKSLNQKRYSVIRECMDTAAKNFAIKQEQTKRYNEMMERRQQKINEESNSK